MASMMPELVKGLSDEQAAVVMALGRPLSLKPREELFGLGAPADSIYIIRHGRVALTLPMQVCGREEDVLVEERGPGQTLGWSGLIPPHRFTLKASALIDAEVLALPRQALLDHFESHPATGYCLLSNLAAVVGQRLQVFQTMWVREVQRVVEWRSA